MKTSRFPVIHCFIAPIRASRKAWAKTAALPWPNSKEKATHIFAYCNFNDLDSLGLT
jgi:hypothetical protein